MSKIKKKEIYVLELSKDFYVEAEQTADCYEFWICRENYGIKHSLFGIPVDDHENLRSALCRYKDLFKDFDYMYGYLEDLLESEDVDENFNILE